MAYEGWIEYNGQEFINVSRTVQLAATLGIDIVVTTKASVQWVQDALGGVNYNDITNAPWYDPGYPASAEFAGLMPLSFTGLDDSTLVSTPIEYTGDGGHSGIARNATLPLVANIVIVASTDRGAEYGKRWMDRMLKSNGSAVFCSGADLRFFRYQAVDSPKVHYRDVRLTRGSSTTRKRKNRCSASWTVTFTMTAADPYQYGEEIPGVFDLGGLPTNSAAGLNLDNPAVAGALIGWNANPSSLYTPSLNSTTPISGTSSMRTTRTATSPSTTVSSVVLTGMAGAGLTNVLPVTPGSVLTWAVSVRTSAATRSVLLQVSYRDASNAAVAVSPVSTFVTPAAGVNRRSITHTVPVGAVYAYLAVAVTSTGTAPTGETADYDDLTVDRGSVASTILTAGSTVLVQGTCPQYDYSPIYDPLYPALVASPTAPDFYPDGWDITPGETFQRSWARLTPIEPSDLFVVPVVVLETTDTARMVRFSVWPNDSAVSDQCDPLFSVVVTYLPANQQFYIDGEQQAAYIWDGSSAAVRRTDSLVFSPDANPIKWTAFNDPVGLLVTLDVFADSSGYEGDGFVRAQMALVPKSD